MSQKDVAPMTEQPACESRLHPYRPEGSDPPVTVRKHPYNGSPVTWCAGCHEAETQDLEDYYEELNQLARDQFR